MKDKYMIRKYAATLALAVSAIVFLPVALLAQGAVTVYADGGCSGPTCNGWFNQYPSADVTSFPSDAQLDRLTHIIATSIWCNHW